MSEKINSVDMEALNVIFSEYNKRVGYTQGQNSGYDAMIFNPKFEELDARVKEYYPAEYSRSYLKMKNQYFELRKSMNQEKKANDNNQYKA